MNQFTYDNEVIDIDYLNNLRATRQFDLRRKLIRQSKTVTKNNMDIDSKRQSRKGNHKMIMLNPKNGNPSGFGDC